MNTIRPAGQEDLARIAEIVIFNYRLNFYPIFRDDEFYFRQLQVPSLMEEYRKELNQLYVYDDGTVKGFIQISGREIVKLFVEPVLHDSGIGSQLLTYAIRHHQADRLWVLEKNPSAIRFYRRHGFTENGERKFEEGTDEYLIRLLRDN